MPVIHRYAKNKGYYVKSAFEGKITTYQVSSQGEAYMQKRGYREGSTISVEELIKMKNKGYIYSGGSGPGEIDPLPRYYQLDKSSNRKHRPQTKQVKKRRQGCCCALALPVMVLALIGLAIHFIRLPKYLPKVH